MTLANAPFWTQQNFDDQSAIARNYFRDERMVEPLEEYSRHFLAARSTMEDLLELSVDLSNLEDLAPSLLIEASVLEAIRYLTGPPISKDDLETVAEVVVSASSIKRDASQARKAMSTVLLGIDRNRFPWLSEDREPTEAERAASVVATAALIASRKVMTARANEGKNAQEQKAKDALAAVGFREVSTRVVNTLVDAPGRGEFCGESLFGQRKADIVVRLWDDRVMPIECKVSNSATNSVKRLNNDAAVKAKSWIEDFGRTQVVPSAMVAGVFKTNNLVAAQTNGLTIWWSHDLGQLTTWIDRTRPGL